MNKYFKHAYTDDKGRKVYEAKDGERLINLDIKGDRVSKSTIATVKENGEPFRRLSFSSHISAVYRTASGDIAVIFKTGPVKEREL